MKYTITIASILIAGSAGAQTWQANSYDSGALIHGVAFAAGGSLSFSCTAPSPGGRPLMETGDHEALRTDQPYGLAISFSDALVDPVGADPSLPAPKMTLDGTTYPLPPMEYSDFHGAWTGISSVEAPGFLELFQATKMIVDPGRGTAYDYPIDGLSAALDAAFGDCIERWFTLGHALPPRLQQYVTNGVAPNQPTPTPVPKANAQTGPDLPPGLSHAPVFELPDVAPQAAFDHVYSRCGGPFEVKPDAITATDLDQDGAADYILNYSGLDCGNGQAGGGYCGASNCSIEVFLSSRQHRNPEEYLGYSLTPVVDGQGRTGLILSGSFSVCGETGQCLPPAFWNGTGFSQ